MLGAKAAGYHGRLIFLANDEHRLDARGSAGAIDDATVDDEGGVHVQSFRPSKRRALSASQRGASSLPPLAG